MRMAHSAKKGSLFGEEGEGDSHTGHDEDLVIQYFIESGQKKPLGSVGVAQADDSP